MKQHLHPAMPGWGEVPLTAHYAQLDAQTSAPGDTRYNTHVAHPDFVIAGAGIIGLSLALELARTGASVTVLEAGKALAQTRTSAAGMLAVDDPGNPPALHSLATLSAGLYPAWLDRIADLGGRRVPFQTVTTLQAVRPDTSGILPDPTELLPDLTPGLNTFTLLDERSVDPRQLAHALLAAVHAAGVDLREHTRLDRLPASPDSISVDTPAGPVAAPFLIDCMGTWSPAPVSPRKGQMLAVELPLGLDLDLTLRTEEVYLVPRTAGPDAGRVIIGATVEDAGFDLEVHPLDIMTLNARACNLLPPLAGAKFLESWSGLRPSTADGLPFLGATARQPRYILATGHFRNGILLAPATAHLLTQLLTGRPLDLDLTPFSPARL